MAMHDKSDPLLNRLIKAHAAIKISGAGDFATTTKAQQSARADGKILGKNPHTSYFATGFDIEKIRKAFEEYKPDGCSPHPFIWILELKLKVIAGDTKMTSSQLTVLREIETVVQACASVHPDIAKEFEKINRERDQFIQDRYGAKRTETGPTPFEQFSGKKKAKEA